MIRLFLGPCASISRRCTALATISLSSDSLAGQALPSAEQLRKLGDRHTGIGFDQALVLEKPRRPDTAVFLPHLQFRWG